MKTWRERVPEVAFLLNPAFCSLVIHEAVVAYQKEAGEGLRYPEAYLILPIVLHRETRLSLSSKTHMKKWIQHNSPLLIDFSHRAKSLVAVSYEAVDFSLQTGLIVYREGKLYSRQPIASSRLDRISDEEMKECFSKAQHVGRWFARAGSGENIYAAWGVRP